MPLEEMPGRFGSVPFAVASVVFWFEPVRLAEGRTEALFEFKPFPEGRAGLSPSAIAQRRANSA